MKEDRIHLKELDNYLMLKNYSLATRKSNRCAVKQSLEFNPRKYCGNSISLELDREYILYRYKSGLKRQTINNEYSVISKFYRYFLNTSRGVKVSLGLTRNILHPLSYLFNRYYCPFSPPKHSNINFLSAEHYPPLV